MLNRRLIYAALCAGFALTAVPGHAAGVADPFSTEALTNQPSGKNAEFQPCPALPATALMLSDVVTATLCGNPLTREVWANARVQAASVGLAESA